MNHNTDFCRVNELFFDPYWVGRRPVQQDRELKTLLRMFSYRPNIASKFRGISILHTEDQVLRSGNLTDKNHAL